MSNLFSLGRSGLSAAQVGINTTGHNIANVNTAGYSRQQVMLSTAGAQGSAAGYVGRGVQVDTVRRIYDGFLTGQLNQASSQGAALGTHANQLEQINNLLADRTAGIAPAITRFFEGVNAVASAPADPAARQELVGQAGSLVSQLHTANQFLQSQREQLNQQISTSVASINSYAERINTLNQQIVTARGTVHGQPPNDLLDQRDELVAGLNELIKVSVVEQGDSFNLVVGNGQTLLSGDTVYPLAAVQSSADPARLAVAYTATNGTTVELPDNKVTGGMLGGLMAFRTESLDPVQNELGRLAVGLAVAFNDLHAQGVDLRGETGQPFFNVPAAVHALADAGNADSNAVLSFSYTWENTEDPAGPRESAAGALTTSDYRVAHHAEGDPRYTITRLSDNSTYHPDELDGFRLDGIEFKAPGEGGWTGGNVFLVQPTRNAAGQIGLAITDGSQIAAAKPGSGTANGENGLALAQLQTTKTLGNGAMSFSEAYSQLVNRVGVQTQSIQTASAAQDSLVSQNYAAQQAVSGVNLNEEYINLDFYVQQYNASARLVEVAGTLFDTLLGLR